MQRGPLLRTRGVRAVHRVDDRVQRRCDDARVHADSPRGETFDVDGLAAWGVGIHPSIVTASLHAVVNAVNRAALARQQQAAALHAFDRV